METPEERIIREIVDTIYENQGEARAFQAQAVWHSIKPLIEKMAAPEKGVSMADRKQEGIAEIKKGLTWIVPVNIDEAAKSLYDRIAPLPVREFPEEAIKELLADADVWSVEGLMDRFKRVWDAAHIAEASKKALGAKRMTIKVRRDIGKEVKPEVEQVDGKTYWFRPGWLMDENDPYPNEEAWIVNDLTYPLYDAPIWIASGDLIEPEPKGTCPTCGGSKVVPRTHCPECGEGGKEGVEAGKDVAQKLGCNPQGPVRRLESGNAT